MKILSPASKFFIHFLEQQLLRGKRNTEEIQVPEKESGPVSTVLSSKKCRPRKFIENKSIISFKLLNVWQLKVPAYSLKLYNKESKHA